MSGRVFQNIVLQFKDAVDTEIGVIDAEGTVIACTELSEIGSHWSELVSSINDAEESVIPVGGKTFKALSGWNGHFDFAIFCLFRRSFQIKKHLCARKKRKEESGDDIKEKNSNGATTPLLLFIFIIAQS